MSFNSVDVGGLPLVPHGGLTSRSLSQENTTGAKGAGGQAGGTRKGAPCITPFRAGETATLADVDGPGCIRHIWLTTPPGNPRHDRNLIVRCYWTGQAQPSVECPLGDFFGMAHGRRRPYASALTSMPEGRGLSCYYAMPFRQHARITLENRFGRGTCLSYFTDQLHAGRPSETSRPGYFHAQFRRAGTRPRLRQDYVVLDGVRGRGRFLGCVIGVRTLDAHWWGEGEFKFIWTATPDYPTICGTGAEITPAPRGVWASTTRLITAARLYAHQHGKDWNATGTP